MYGYRLVEAEEETPLASDEEEELFTDGLEMDEEDEEEEDVLIDILFSVALLFLVVIGFHGNFNKEYVPFFKILVCSPSVLSPSWLYYFLWSSDFMVC